MLSMVTGIWCLYNMFDHSVRQRMLIRVLTRVYTVSVVSRFALAMEIFENYESKASCFALAMEGPLRTLKAGPLLAT